MHRSLSTEMRHLTPPRAIFSIGKDLHNVSIIDILFLVYIFDALCLKAISHGCSVDKHQASAYYANQDVFDYWGIAGWCIPFL
jgi:hypothetical protein